MALQVSDPKNFQRNYCLFATFVSMAKVIKFPIPTPEKFGPEKVRKKKTGPDKKTGQLNLFTSGRIIRLHQLSPFEEALMLDEQGNKIAAREGYLKAIDDGDSIADAYCNLGIIESQNGLTAKAIDSFTQCLRHDPRHYEAHYNLANLYAEVGNLALAKVHYEISIEIEPSFTNSYFNLGLTLAMSKQFKDAVKVLDEYKKLSPPENQQQAEDLIQKLITF
jgi:tetratricopeptide (TPR) repeat protein